MNYNKTGQKSAKDLVVEELARINYRVDQLYDDIVQYNRDICEYEKKETEKRMLKDQALEDIEFLDERVRDLEKSLKTLLEV